MKRILLVFTTLSTLVICCSGTKTNYPKVSVTNELRDSIKGSDRIFVFEGLPHQMSEAKLLKAEKKRKDIIKIAGYPFYTPKIKVEGESLTALRTIISNSENYVQFRGEKRCGGFHPDYAVEWHDKDKLYSILFCYGCSEVLVVDGKLTYRYDFEFTAELKKLLSAFDLKRP